jgi:hypothetical protein
METHFLILPMSYGVQNVDENASENRYQNSDLISNTNHTLTRKTKERNQNGLQICDLLQQLGTIPQSREIPT